MTEEQQLNLPWTVVGPVIAGTVSIILFVMTNWWNGVRSRLIRSREVFSKAYTVVQEYKEFPYVIRRRMVSSPEEERVRISSELLKVQVDLAFYSAWLMTESVHVHRSYTELLDQLRRVIGTAMHEAWLEPAVDDDSKMNMPDMGHSALILYERDYLKEVGYHLSLWPRWLRRLCERQVN